MLCRGERKRAVDDGSDVGDGEGDFLVHFKRAPADQPRERIHRVEVLSGIETDEWGP